MEGFQLWKRRYVFDCYIYPKFSVPTNVLQLLRSQQGLFKRTARSLSSKDAGHSVMTNKEEKSYEEKWPQKKNSDQSDESRSQRDIPMSEVQKHNQASDCWMVIGDKVYNVTKWIEKHPGGDVILTHAGLDATDVFEAFHADSSYRLLPAYLIGRVTNLQVSPALQEYRKLRKMLTEEKQFEASEWYYAYKFLSTVSLLPISFTLMSYFGSTLWGAALAIISVSFFWQQCGWLSHDFLHHQVFKERRYNNMAGYLLGNLGMGFSLSWWKRKHNLHHATPNVTGFDPDIDTFPLLSWSEQLIEGDLSGLPRLLVKYQHIFVFPILAFGRISWLIQSILHVCSNRMKHHKMEAFLLALHYVWFLFLSFGFLSFGDGILFFLVSQFVGGLLLASAFIVNHNGKHVFPSRQITEGELDFINVQVLTGRDIKGGPFNFFHWFMGGLDMQIEHHLFPGLPRHNLKGVQGKVVELCKQYGIEHHQTSFFQGLREVLRQLKSVSRSAVGKWE